MISEVEIMCKLCLKTPCASRCPNNTGSEPEKRCACCGYPIEYGMIYYRLLGSIICESCVDDAQEVEQ
jgi:hypothetical protein